MTSSNYLLKNMTCSPCRIYTLLESPIAVFNSHQNTSHEFATKIASSKTTQQDFEPFFVMDMDCVSRALDLWTDQLPRVRPFYSLKCNADQVLLRLLASVNPEIGFNCCMPGELQTALEHVSAERVICSNPCWTRSALRESAEQSVPLLTFESERDLDRILTNHPNADLLLHVCMNPDSEDTTALFGCPLDGAPEMLKSAAALGMNCVGISFSMGVECIRPALYEYAIEYSARLFRDGLAMGLRMSVLNIGDGIAVPTDERQAKLFVQLCARINASLDEHFSSDTFGNGQLRIMATPGRFFAGTAFSLITNVIGKRVIDESLVTNNDMDSGKEAFLYQVNESYYGAFACQTMASCEPRCAPLFHDEHADSAKVHGIVLGSMGLDDPGTDIVQPVCHFRQLHIGDWLFWANMGAYSFGNKVSLDGEFDAHDPVVFYYVSRSNWVRFATALKAELDEPYDYPYSDDGGSCGAQEAETEEEEEEVTRAEKEEQREKEEKIQSNNLDGDEFWPCGWPHDC